MKRRRAPLLLLSIGLAGVTTGFAASQLRANLTAAPVLEKRIGYAEGYCDAKCVKRSSSRRHPRLGIAPRGVAIRPKSVARGQSEITTLMEIDMDYHCIGDVILETMKNDEWALRDRLYGVLTGPIPGVGPPWPDDPEAYRLLGELDQMMRRLQTRLSPRRDQIPILVPSCSPSGFVRQIEGIL